MAKISVSIVLATYNAKDTICRLIQKITRVLSAQWVDLEMIVVDDSSPDGTSQAIRNAFGLNRSVKLITRNLPRNPAAAVKDGILSASKEQIVIMDAGYNHSPDDIPRLLTSLDRADVINGSRFLKGGGMSNAGLRLLGSFIFNGICRRYLGLRVTDVTGAFFLISREKILKLPLDRIFAGDAGFMIRFHYAVKKKKWSILEIPIYYPERARVKSKSASLNDLLRNLVEMIKTPFQI